MIFLAAHIVPTLVIFTSNTTVQNISLIDYELSCFNDSTYEPENSKFGPFASSYEQDNQLF